MEACVFYNISDLHYKYHRIYLRDGEKYCSISSTCYMRSGYSARLDEETYSFSTIPGYELAGLISFS